MKAPMKILMTTDTVGGVWTYTIELCKSLEPYNINVHLVTLGEKLNNHQQREIESLQNVELHETDYRLEWMENPWRDIDESGKWLLRIEEAVQPDLIHLNCFAYGNLPFKAPVVVVAHSDVYSWFMQVRKEDPSPEWKEYYWRVRKGLEGADLVIAPSNEVLRQIRSNYRFRTNSKVIYNARSNEHFFPADKELSVLSMGRVWDEAKNIRLLTEASAQISCPIRIAGDTTYAGNHFNAWHPNVSFLGRLDTHTLSKELARAAIYVLPAKYEPFGLSILEAALSGCVLVLGDIPSLREIWGDTALYVDINDAEALANIVNSLLADYRSRELYSRKSYAHALKYSTERMARQYRNTYMQLVQKQIEFTSTELI
jgi:glycogen synthase